MYPWLIRSNKSSTDLPFHFSYSYDDKTSTAINIVSCLKPDNSIDFIHAF
jgi:hypothetical protein